MKRALCVVALCFPGSVLGCHQSGGDASEKSKPRAAAATADADRAAYNRDVDRFCFAEKHADALDIETTARGLVVAEWLGKNLETTAARTFLASLQPLTPAEKETRLRAEAARAKLSACPTADAWAAEIR